MALKVLCIGEAMLELSEAGAAADGAPLAKIGVAGDTLNCAIYLARCAAGAAEVEYVTALGQDPHSGRMAAFIAGQGVGTARIRRMAGKLPGLYAITTDGGERSFHYWRSAAAARAMFDGDEGPDFSALDGADVLYLSAISLAILAPATRAALIARLGALRETGARVAFDSNYRPALWESVEAAREAVSAMWAITDIPLPSVDDEMALFGDASEDAALARIAAICPGAGAMKRAAKGPAGLGGEPVPARDWPAAVPLDTTAAGDSFNGGYLGAILRGESREAAMEAGHRLAAAVVTHRGAIIPESAMPR